MKAITDTERLKVCKHWLISNDLTAKELAKRLSITQQSLHDYMRGRMTSARLDKVFGLDKGE